MGDSVNHTIRGIRNGRVGSVGVYNMCRCFFGYCSKDSATAAGDAALRQGTLNTVDTHNLICVGHVAIGRYTPFEDKQQGSRQEHDLERGDSCGVVLYLYVLPSFRSRGYGTEMLKQALAETRGDVSSVIVLIHIDNKRAKKFYTHCGFGKTNITKEKPGGKMELWVHKTQDKASLDKV